MSDEKSTTDAAPGRLDRVFHLTELGTNPRREVIGGLTTFLAMAYILFVNPAILGEAGMDAEAVFVATALASAIGTLIMGLWARYPIAQAPGMGLNAFFTFSVVIGMGVPWETALTGVLVSGVLFLALTLTGARESIINAIPLPLKFATGAGIGLFIAFIGLDNAEIVVADPDTLVALGDLTATGPLLAAFGIVVTGVFLVRGFRGGVFYGMVVTAVVGILVGYIAVPEAVLSGVPSLAPTFGVALLNLPDLVTGQLLIVVFTFLFVDFFDTTGTLMAVAHQAGFLQENRLPRANRALTSDAIATVSGAVLGTSTTTSYIESTAGIAAGARSGLSSVVVAGLFCVALFFSPLLAVVAPEVTAPALVIVGVLMASALGNIDWSELEFAIPAFVTVIAMPLTFSIATGIALGLLLFPVMMLVRGRHRELHPIMYGLFIVFVIYFGWLAV